MRRRPLFLSLTGLVLLWSCIVGGESAWADAETDRGDTLKNAGFAPAPTAQAAPGFSLPDLSGADVHLADYAGKMVLINFWATWCAPCVVEMPTLENLGKKLGEDGLVVLAVSLDVSDTARVTDFVRGYGWQLPVLLDPLSTVGDAYSIRVMPTSYLIDRDGTILGRSFGARTWDDAETVSHFKTLLQSSDFSSP